MKGFEQQRAHELAQLAIRWAQELEEGEICAMQTEQDGDGHKITFTLRLTNAAGSGNTHDVKTEGDTPAGESLPF